MLLNIYTRWLPEGGIKIYPDIQYLDVNDIPIEKRKQTRDFFEEDEAYKKARGRNACIHKTGWIKKRIGAYVRKKEEDLGVITAWEVLGNEDGYEEKDFFMSKLIYPKFRHTKYSRYAASDFIHIGFMSGIANKFWGYMPALNNDSNFFYDVLDTKAAPCEGMRFPSDGPTVQKYILIKKRIDTIAGPMVLIEYNGDIYRSMDLKEYMNMVPGRSQEVVDRWLKEMNEAAKRVIKE